MVAFSPSGPFAIPAGIIGFGAGFGAVGAVEIAGVHFNHPIETYLKRDHKDLATHINSWVREYSLPLVGGGE